MFKRTSQEDKYESAGQSRVVKTTTVLRRDGKTETTTTEVLETTLDAAGGRGTAVSQTVKTSSHSSSSSSAAQQQRQLFGDFDRLALDGEQRRPVKRSEEEKPKSKSAMGAILCKLGGKKDAADDAVDAGHDDHGGSDSAKSFANQCLKAHNEKRKLHDVPHLKLSKKLNEYAKKWADTLAREDSFRHSEGEYGENIYMKWSSNANHMITGEDPVNSWYDEIKLHEFGREPSSLSSGHFTQVVWKGSKELGVACARSKTGKIIVVASYLPAGNMRGSYVDNVLPPRR